jgi:hypothetical protein
MPPQDPTGDIPSESDASIDLDPLRCSFCGKQRDQVEAMLSGPTPAVTICNECVELCNEIVAEQRRPPFD